MAPQAGKVKKVYSFIASTIPLDPSTQVGEALLRQIPPFVTQSLSGQEPAFKSLSQQAQSGNVPSEMGTGMCHSKEDYPEAFLAWLKTKGVTVNNIAHLLRTQIFLMAGDAMHPVTRQSFNWCMFLYFDL